MKICINCAKRIKTKDAPHGNYSAGKCEYCNNQSYVADTKDFGITATAEVGDEGVEYLKNMFNMK